MHCTECVKSIRMAIQAHTVQLIKDNETAQAFVQSASNELFKLLESREEAKIHKHHKTTEHYELENDLRKKLDDTRRVILNV